MDIQATKLKTVKAILEIDNTDFIQKVADFIQTEKTDFWDELSVEQQNEIKQGSLDILQENATEYETFMSKYR